MSLAMPIHILIGKPINHINYKEQIRNKKGKKKESHIYEWFINLFFFLRKGLFR